MVMNDWPTCCWIGPPIPKIQLFQNFTMKTHGKCYACDQSYLKIWPWRFDAKVMTKIKTDGYIWGQLLRSQVWKSLSINMDFSRKMSHECMWRDTIKDVVTSLTAMEPRVNIKNRDRIIVSRVTFSILANVFCYRFTVTGPQLIK